MRRSVFSTARSRPDRGVGFCDNSVRPSSSSPELLTIKTLDAAPDVASIVETTSVDNFSVDAFLNDCPIGSLANGDSTPPCLDLNARQRKPESLSLKKLRLPSKSSSSAFFPSSVFRTNLSSNLSPRFSHLRRRRRPKSAQRKQQQQQQTQHQDQPQHDPECNIAPSSAPPYGGKVADGLELLCNEEENDGKGDEDGLRDRGGRSLDLKALKDVKKQSQSCPTKKTFPIYPVAECRDRHPFLSIVRTFAKSFSTPSPSSSSGGRRIPSDVEAGDSRAAEGGAAVEETSKNRKSSRRASFVDSIRFRRNGGNENPEEARESKIITETTQLAKESGPPSAAATKDDNDYSDNVDAVNDEESDEGENERTRHSDQNDLSICKHSSFPPRKFPRNITDTITSSLYEQTVDSVDSAYYSLTVGKSAAISAAPDPVGFAAAETYRKGRLGVDLPGAGHHRLDGFGLEPGFFEAAQRPAFFLTESAEEAADDDGVDGRKSRARSKIPAFVARRDKDSEKFVDCVAIDMEKPTTAGMVESFTGPPRKKSDVILPLSLDGGSQLENPSDLRENFALKCHKKAVLASRVAPVVKERFSVNRVPESAIHRRAPPPLPSHNGKVSWTVGTDCVDSLASEQNSIFVSTGSTPHRMDAPKANSTATAPQPAKTVFDAKKLASEVRPLPEVPSCDKRRFKLPRTASGLHSGFSTTSTRSSTVPKLSTLTARDRPLPSSQSQLLVNRGFRCSEQQLVNGSQDDDECFFYREKVPLTAGDVSDLSSESSAQQPAPDTGAESQDVQEVARPVQEVPTVVVTGPSEVQGNPQAVPVKKTLTTNDSRESSVQRQMDRVIVRDSQSSLISPSVIADPNLGLDNNAYHTTVNITENGSLPLCDDLQLYHAKKATEASSSPAEAVPTLFAGVPRVDTQGRKRVRLVEKHGTTNIAHSKIPRRWLRYWSDIFTTMLEMKWRYVFVIFASQFFLSWVLFALIWYLICWAHGDFENKNKEADGFVPCVTNMNDFTSAILFSIETQHTIGYGSRYTTEECAGAVFVMMIQSIFGIFGQACIVGLVFTKLARPKKRAQTLLLSKRAVICLRDRKYRLLFRVGDVRPDFMTDCKVQAILIQRKTTKEGESLPLHQTPIPLETCELFLTWPIVIGHEIDAESPFYCMDEHDMNEQDFELVIVVEGNVEATAMRTQIRTSFLPDEIQWGYHFQPCVRFGEGRYIVDYSKFHETVKCHMPKVSAQKWELMDSIYLLQNENGDSASETESLNREQNNDKKNEDEENDENGDEVFASSAEKSAHAALASTDSTDSTDSNRQMALSKLPPTRSFTHPEVSMSLSGSNTPPTFSSATSVGGCLGTNARASPNRTNSQSSNFLGVDYGPRGFRPSTPVQVINFYTDS